MVLLPVDPTLPSWQSPPSLPTWLLPPVPVFRGAAVPCVSRLGCASFGSAPSWALPGCRAAEPQQGAAASWETLSFHPSLSVGLLATLCLPPS